MLPLGLNPYGLAYSLGLQAVGTARANPEPHPFAHYDMLAEFYSFGGIEIHAEHLFALPDPAGACRALAGRYRQKGWWVVLARPLRLGDTEAADRWPLTFEVARLLGARTIRMHLTPVLCGDRRSLGANAPWADWRALMADVRPRLARVAAAAREHGLRLAIEDHQDLTSGELLDLCASAGDNVGICLDTANPLAVGEDPLAFARAVKPRLAHVHFKDYRAAWTDEGYRLCRCPTGDGCVPIREIAAELADAPVTCSVEVGALEARHIKLLTPDWWTHHPPHAMEQLLGCLRTARVNRHLDGDDWRTPWERNESPKAIETYELAQVIRSQQNLAAMGVR